MLEDGLRLLLAVASHGPALVLLPHMRMVVAHVESADGDTTQAQEAKSGDDQRGRGLARPS